LESTRIVLIDMPPLLREIVRETLAPEPDLHVVAEHGADVDVMRAVEEADADFVIVGTELSGRSVAEVGAGGWRVRGLELHVDGSEGVLYELRPHWVSVGELSPAALVRTIRAVSTGDDES
jgi:DNA-binding NarL/FixJ family response regulator